MSILSDTEIIKLVKEQDIIKPFVHQQTKHTSFNDWRDDDETMTKLISYGLSSYGYDCRARDRYLVYHNALATYIDPKAFDERSFVEVSGKGHVFIPPNSFVLTETIEYIRVPRDCLVLVAAKSTYARVGLVVNATLLEPEWEGTVTLELSNTTPLPVKVYSGEGIVQLIFMRSDTFCETSYADRQGKYQNQFGITLPKV